jgi:exonuclease III
VSEGQIWSIATQNVRGLRSELEMRCWKQYMVEEKVDICCVTETHLDEKRERLLISILEDKFECLSRIREERKRGDYGSGGGSSYDQEE